jgi:hypothetical protein
MKDYKDIITIEPGKKGAKRVLEVCVFLLMIFWADWRLV